MFPDASDPCSFEGTVVKFVCSGADLGFFKTGGGGRLAGSRFPKCCNLELLKTVSLKTLAMPQNKEFAFISANLPSPPPLNSPPPEVIVGNASAVKNLHYG